MIDVPGEGPELRFRKAGIICFCQRNNVLDVRGCGSIGQDIIQCASVRCVHLPDGLGQSVDDLVFQRTVSRTKGVPVIAYTGAFLADRQAHPRWGPGWTLSCARGRSWRYGRTGTGHVTARVWRAFARYAIVIGVTGPLSFQPFVDHAGSVPVVSVGWKFQTSVPATSFRASQIAVPIEIPVRKIVLRLRLRGQRQNNSRCRYPTDHCNSHNCCISSPFGVLLPAQAGGCRSGV